MTEAIGQREEDNTIIDIYIAHIHIKLNVSEWDVGGKSDTTSYVLDSEVTLVGEELVVNKAFPKRYTFIVKEMSDTEICLSCECPPSVRTFEKGRTLSC